jgi:ActR/RegA family two-component response regulator
MEPDEFDRLRAAVLADPVLQDELLTIRDVHAFADRLARISEERGFGVSADDVRDNVHAARRAWFERWV